MSCRVGSASNIRLMSRCTTFNKVSTALPVLSHPQLRSISQSSVPSQSGMIQMSHLNPDIISKIEKQIAAQGNQISRAGT